MYVWLYLSGSFERFNQAEVGTLSTHLFGWRLIPGAYIEGPPLRPHPYYTYTLLPPPTIDREQTPFFQVLRFLNRFFQDHRFLFDPLPSTCLPCTKILKSLENR